MVKSKKLRRVLSFFVAAAILFTVVLTQLFTNIKADAAASGFYVSGTKLLDANGNQFVMRGVNIAHTWYPSYTETSIKAAAKLGANTVRIVLSDGGQYNKTSESEVEQIIDWCKENKLVCILEIHDATGSDNTSDLNRAVNYWIDIKNLLNENRKYVILNIANEWYGTWDGSGWANGNKNAIKSLRSAGIKNTIIVDCAGWGQYPASVHNYGKEVFNADSEGNTVFSIHMYEYSGGDSSTVKNNIDKALGIGVPVIIGEFGFKHSNGDVDEDTIMSYCTSKKVGYLGWSWKGNGGGVEYLDLANSWDGSSLTDWGNTLFNSTYGIKKTSSICSIYGGSSSSGSSSSGSSSSGSSSSGSSSSGSSSSGSGSSSSGSSSSTNYVSLFYGSASASNWNQAVAVDTKKNGGSFDASNIKSGGHFYVEYKGDKGKVELILQSWSGGSSWGKVSMSEQGTANGNYYAKFSYSNCVSTFGSSDFSSKLDKVHVGATDGSVEIVSVCYDFGSGSSSSGSSSSGSSSSGSSSSGSSSSGSSSSGSSSSTNYVSLFYGSASASNWNQAVAVDTKKNGGSFDASNIKSGGHFYVEYKGDKGKVELILQSWSGGSSWGKVSMSEQGTANGNYYAKFSYSNCVSTFGSSDFSSKLDKVHVGATDGSVQIVSVCYDFGSGSSSSGSSSSGSSSSGSSSSGSSSSGSSSSGSSSSTNYVSLFYGSASASNWNQAVAVDTKKNGGSFDASNIKSGGHFYVEYKGDKGKVELILQSWSGGSSWGKVSMSEQGTANGNYYAKFSYSNCVSTFGSSDFSSKLDKVHVGATDGSVEIVSVCYDFGSGSSSSGGSTSGGSSSTTESLDGIYYIKNYRSGLYLDVYYGQTGNGTNIRQWYYNGENAQKFKLVSDGNGYYSILTGATNYSSAVDVEAKKTADGTNIIQWSYGGGNNQKFEFVKVGNAYVIKTKISGSNSCLEVADASYSAGANVDQWTYSGNSHQLWYLEKAS